MSTLLKIRGQICGGSLTDVYGICWYKTLRILSGVIFGWCKQMLKIWQFFERFKALIFEINNIELIFLNKKAKIIQKKINS